MTALKLKIFLIFFYSVKTQTRKNAIKVALEPIPLADIPKKSSNHGEISPKRTSKLQENPSPPKRKHPELENMKFLNFFFYFCGSFLPFWIRIRFQPTKIYADPDRKKVKNSSLTQKTGGGERGRQKAGHHRRTPLSLLHVTLPVSQVRFGSNDLKN
jgi:hypothetical protein